jgi:hypothetical protein
MSADRFEEQAKGWVELLLADLAKGYNTVAELRERWIRLIAQELHDEYWASYQTPQEVGE